MRWNQPLPGSRLMAAFLGLVVLLAFIWQVWSASGLREPGGGGAPFIEITPGAKPRHTPEEVIRAAAPYSSGKLASVRFSGGTWRLIYRGSRNVRPSGSIVEVDDSSLTATSRVLK